MSDTSQLRTFESDASGAFQSPLNAIPINTQRYVIDLIRRDKDDSYIVTMSGLHISTVRALRQRNAISPRKSRPYRCGGCGLKVIATPCFVCESRRMAGVPTDG